jgi:hypothetical protein
MQDVTDIVDIFELFFDMDLVQARERERERERERAREMTKS